MVQTPVRIWSSHATTPITTDKPKGTTVNITFTIDTEDQSPLTLRVLRALASPGISDDSNLWDEEKKPAAKAAPAKAAPVGKAAPKVEEPEEATAEPEESEAATMADAVAAATKLVSSGQAARVKAALSDLGAKRVSELKEPADIAKFVKALA